ncbi:HET-domain-containing protein [Dichotomopilus funicola]|uniref:HET-domain-containing protein n=1 Tax=Dichotomopilus funicola TaxID=1934379 RepID=A0AAN6V0L3_9PEZI|nr:HET-domain-containing protein [Dichotomopilus funicola]
MRLLHTTKLHLAEEEVSFQDVQKGLAQSRRGYEKVVGACALAWIDTCCIDKSSSAELSKAINSMSDVDADENPYSEVSSFYKARWFTRRWTLQELMVPGVVYFYGAGWKQIGSQETFLDLIFSAAQTMSWAANHETTRLKDEAYSLLGLFDITMLLLYGEGERAFQRLQEGILRQSEDDSLFAHRDSDILARSPESFCNCADVTRLDDAWPYHQNPALLLNRNLSRSDSIFAAWATWHMFSHPWELATMPRLSSPPRRAMASRDHPRYDGARPLRPLDHPHSRHRTGGAAGKTKKAAS